MKKTIFLSILVSMLMILSCNKNQKVVKELEGTWNVTAKKENGKEVPDSVFAGDKFVFQKCRVKKGDCDGTMTSDGKAVPFTYAILDKGTKIRISINLFGFTDTETGDILEHSKNKFVYKITGDTLVTETTLEK